MFKLDEPLNANERYLHGVSVRLEILIELVSSLVDTYASNNEVTVENNTYEEVVVNNEISDYDLFTVSELKDYLENVGIEYKSSMRKSELIELLR